MLSRMSCVRSRFTWWWLGISKEKDTERGFHNAIDTTTKGQYPKEEGESVTTEEDQYQKGRVNNQPKDFHRMEKNAGPNQISIVHTKLYATISRERIKTSNYLEEVSR